MTTAIDIVMFIVPLMVAVIFTILTITSKNESKNTGLFSNTLVAFLSSLISSISWSIFGLTWPAVASSEMLSSIAYLWYALGVIFAVFTLYIGLRMLLAIFDVKQPRLKLEQNSIDRDD